MDKIEIIKEIVKHHPGHGTDRNYSWYVGGMKDTGDWNWDVMIDEPIERLQEFLYNLRAKNPIKQNQ